MGTTVFEWDAKSFAERTKRYDAVKLRDKIIRVKPTVSTVIMIFSFSDKRPAGMSALCRGKEIPAIPREKNAVPSMTRNVSVK